MWRGVTEQHLQGKSICMRAESPRALGICHQERKIGTEITWYDRPYWEFHISVAEFTNGLLIDIKKTNKQQRRKKLYKKRNIIRVN